MINDIYSLGDTQETLCSNYETMTSQLKNANRKIRYLENEISTHIIVNYAEEDTKREESVGKPGTLEVKKKAF